MQKFEGFIGAIDQGTTSTRFILFDHNGSIVSTAQKEHRQIFPKPGWVEHDAQEIWNNTAAVIRAVMTQTGIGPEKIAAVGITNQRETVVAWDSETGNPCAPAIVWQDLRGSALIDELAVDGGIDRLRAKTGLALSPYFSASKISWLLNHHPELSRKAASGTLRIGTVDSWLIWKLTGSASRNAGEEVFITDASNASRYLLMDLETLAWDSGLLDLFGVPEGVLPRIQPSYGTIYGVTDADGPFGGEVPLGGILGDQQAALFGQACFEEGMAKNTYGTGCFLLVNTGSRLCSSRHGLLTTAAYHPAGEPPRYALEGSIAVAGSLVQWLRDNLGLIRSAPEINQLAERVPDNGGLYFVPAFSGLFAPYWRSDARGIIAGLTGYASAGHIARAVLEATAFQASDIFHAMQQDSGIELKELRVDGGMTNSSLLMQFQADILGIPVVRPAVAETTALGAAYAAGLTVGFWSGTDELATHWKEAHRWNPDLAAERRKELLGGWHKAVERTLNWSD